MYRLFCLAFAATLAGLAYPVFADEPRQITVTGTADVSAVPDMATLSVGVVAANPEAGAAVSEMSAALAKVIEALRAAGIAEKDIQTSAVDLSPRYEQPDADRHSPPEITGFEARSTLSVTTRDLSALGTLLDSVVNGGSNQIDGLTFGLEDSDGLADEARRAAVADALAKADLYATAAGVVLGEVQSISEVLANPMPQMKGRAMMMASDAAVPVAQGEVSLSAEVLVTIALGD